MHLAYCAASGQRENDLPYGNIIAFDAGAAVLHYQHLEHGRDAPRRSFLIDAGAQFRGYALDITRTWSAGDPEFARAGGRDGRAATRCSPRGIRAGRDYRDVHLEAHRAIGRLLR